MEQIINIDGQDIRFKATALTPRLYLATFKKDLIRELNALNQATTIDKKTGEVYLSTEATDIFFNIAYIMAKAAKDPSADGKSCEEWLDSFGIFSLYQALPEIYKLWGLSTATTTESKKKADRRHGK